jgi:hypothetical protein
MSAGFISPGTNMVSTFLAPMSSDIMILDINVLGMALLHRVTGNKGSALVVTINGNSLKDDP